MAKNAISYIKNVGKSVAFTALDTVKEMVPVFNDFSETNGEMLKDTYTAAKKLSKLQINDIPNKVMESKYGKFGKTYLRNLTSDLKSGNFYNRERIKKYDDQAANNMMGLNDSDFDLGGFDDTNFDDLDNSWGDVSTNEMIDIVGEKTSNAISNTMARSSEYIVQGIGESNKAIYNRMNGIYIGLHSGMATINENISKIIQFSQEATVAHYENSRTFFENITKLEEERNEYIKEIAQGVKELNKPAQTIDPKYKKNTYSDIVNSEGVINLSSYFKNVKDNLNNKTGGVGDMIKMAVEMGLMDTLTASPLKTILETVMKATIPGILKQSFENFNKSISGIAGNLLMKLKEKGSGFGIWNTISEIFGIDTGLKTSLDTSKYEKGKVPFDGITRKAITEVIPTYLSKILTAVSGQKESRYNYDTGKFVTVDELRKEFNNLTRDSANRAAFELDSIVNQKMYEIKKSPNWDNNRQRQFEEDWNTIKEYMYKNQKNFNTRDKKLNASSFGLKGGIASDINVKLLQELLDRTPANIRYADQMFRERNSQNRRIAEWEVDNPTMTSAFNGPTESDNISAADTKSITDKANRSSLSELIAIHKELSYIRIYGIGGRTISSSSNVSANETRTPGGVILPNGIKPSFDEFEIPDIKTRKGNDREYNKKYDKQTAGKINNIRNTNAEDEVKKILKDVKFEDKNENKTSSKTFSQKMNEAVGLSAKMSVLASSATELAKKPAKFIVSVLDKADERLYDLIYGTREDKEGNKSFAGRMFNGLDKMFNDFSDFLQKNIFDPLKGKFTKQNIHDAAQRFFGMFGIDMDDTVKKAKEYLFGTKGKDGKRDGGIFSKTMNDFKDSMRGAKDWVKGAFRDTADWMGFTSKKNAKGKAKADKNASNDKKADAFSKFADAFSKATATATEAATGIKRVNKTGLAVISEGEAVIPPDMNPFNISKRRRNEKKVKQDLKSGIDSIFEYAEGVKNTASGEKLSKEEQADIFSRIAERNPKVFKKFIQKRSKPGETEEETARRLAEEKRKQKKAFTKDDYETGRNPYVDRVGDEIKKGFKSVFDSIQEAIGVDKEHRESNNEKFKKTASDYISKFKEYSGTMAAGGILGAGVSVITGAIGGPLLGAAVGAGIGLIKKSETVQKMLFGDIDKDGKRTGGLIPKEITNKAQKYFGDMSKGATVGGILSMLPFVPGGPVSGIILGSAIGFAKNNESVQNALFGEGKLLGKKEDFQNKVQRVLPKMGAGALVGLLAGPFGIGTNIILGSALGFASDTNKFKDLIFGEVGEDGKREGGIMKAITQPAVDFFQKMYGEFKEFLFKDMLQPIANAIDPFKQQFKIIGRYITGAFKDTFKMHIGRPIERFLKEAVINPIGKYLGGIFNLVKNPIKWIISRPSALIGRAGDALRKHQIKTGQATYSLASQRNAFRRSKGLKMNLFGIDKYADLDESIANMSDENVDTVANSLEAVVGSKKSLSDIQNKSAKKLRKELYSDKNNINSDLAKTAIDMVKNGSYQEAIKLIQDSNIEDPAAKARILASLSKESAKIKLAEKMKTNRERTITELTDQFKKLGVNISPEMIEKMAKGDKEVLKQYELFSAESKLRKKVKGEKTPTSTIEQMNSDEQKRHEEIVEKIDKIIGLFEKQMQHTEERTGTNKRKKKKRKNITTNTETVSDDNTSTEQEESSNVEEQQENLVDAQEENIQDEPEYYTAGRGIRNLAKKGIKGAFKLPFKTVGLGAKGTLLAGKVIYKSGKWLRHTKPAEFVLGDKNRDWQNDIAGETSAIGKIINSVENKVSKITGVKSVPKKNVEVVHEGEAKGKFSVLGFFKDISTNIKKLTGNISAMAIKDGIDTSNIDDEQKSENYLNKIKNKFKKGVTTVTQFVDGLPIKFRKDKNGDLIPDPGNAENKDTYKAIDEKNKTQKGILSTISSLTGKVSGFFSRFFESKEEESKKSWFLKLFEKIFDPIKFATKVAAALGIAGWAKEKILPGLKSFWDENLYPYLNNAWNGKEEGFGKFVYFLNPENPDGLPNIAKTFVNEKLPDILKTAATYISKGMHWALAEILPGVVSAAVTAIPDILKALGTGLLDGINNLIHGKDNDGKMKNAEGAVFNFTANNNSFSNMSNSNKTPSWFDKNVESTDNSAFKVKPSNNTSYTWKQNSNNSNNTSSITNKANKYIKDTTVLPKAFSNMNSVYKDAALKEYDKVKDNIISTPYGDMTVSDILNSDEVFATTNDGTEIHGYDMLNYNNTAESLGMNIKLSKEDMKKNTEEDGGYQTTVQGETAKFSARALIRSLTGVDAGFSGASKFIKGTTGIVSQFVKRIPLIGKTSGKILKSGGKIASKALQKVPSFTKSLGKVADAAKKNSKLSEFIVTVTEAIKGFFKNNTVYTKISSVIDDLGSSASKKLGSAKEVCDKLSNLLVKKVVDLLETYGGNLGKKAAAKLGAYTASGGFLLIADAVFSFISGWRNANSILGITETPNLVTRLVCGILEAVNSVFVLGLVPLDIVVDAVVWVVQAVGFEVFDDLEIKRKQAQEEVDAYNKEHGTNHSIESYNKKDRLWTKIKSQISKVFGKDENVEPEGSTVHYTNNGTIAGGRGGSFGTDSNAQLSSATHYTNNGTIAGGGGGSFGSKNSADIPQYATGITRVNKTGLAIVSEGEAIIPPDMNPFNIAKRQKDENKVKENIYKYIHQYASGTLYASPNNLNYNNINNFTQNNNKELNGLINDRYSIFSKFMKSINDKVKDMISGVIGTKSEKKKNIKEIFKDDYNLNSKFEYLNDSFNGISKIIKMSFSPILILKEVVNSISDILLKPIDGLTEAAELSNEDKDTIEKANNGNISPFSKEYWTSSSNKTGISGGINRFIGLINKVFNLPSALVSYLNPINLVKKAGNWISDKLSNNNDTDAISESDNTTVGSGSGLLTRKYVGRGSSNGNTFISQVDNKYKNQSFNIPGDTQRQTIGDSGCAPAAAAMAINSTAGGSTTSMEEASRYALKYKEKDDGVNANYFGDEFARHGMGAEYITSDSGNNKNAGIMNNLLRNNKVVLMGQDKNNTSKANSPFGPNPHYVTATGTSKDGKYIYINDPESKTPNKKYKTSKILNSSQIGIAAHSTGRGIKYKAASIVNKHKAQRFGRGIKAFKNPKLAKYVGRATYGPDTVQYRVWVRLRGAGFSEEATAGAMGNIEAESGFRTNNLENNYESRLGSDEQYTKDIDSGKISKQEFMYPLPGNGECGYGLCQWTFHTRKAGLYDYAKEKGVSISDVDMQIDYLIGECQPQDGGCNGHAYKILGNFGNGYTQDMFFNAKNPEEACKVFYYAFEGPPSTDTSWTKRKDAANMYYEAFKGIPGVTGSSGDSISISSDSSSSNTSTIDTANTPVGKILAAFDDLAVAYGLKSRTTTSSSTTTNTDGTYPDSSGTVSPNASIAEKQRAVVDKARSIKGTIAYSMSGPRDPDQGSADCSSFVNWAYKKTLGKDIGGYTGAQTSSSELYNVDEGSGGYESTPNENKLQLGDLLFYIRDYSQRDTRTYPMGIGHVGMYMGDGKEIHHPGGTGPKELALKDATRFRLAMRLKDFKDDGSTSSLSTETDDSSYTVGKGSGLQLQSKSKFIDEAHAVGAVQTKLKNTAKAKHKPFVGMGSYVVPYNLGLKHIQRISTSSANDEINYNDDTEQNIKPTPIINTSKNNKQTGNGSNVKLTAHKKNTDMSMYNGRASKSSNNSLNNAIMIQLVKAIVKLLGNVVTNTDNLNNIAKLLGEYFTAKNSETGTEQTKQKTVIAKQNLIAALQGNNSNSPNQDIMRLIEATERIARE